MYVFMYVYIYICVSLQLTLCFCSCLDPIGHHQNLASAHYMTRDTIHCITWIIPKVTSKFTHNLLEKQMYDTAIWLAHDSQPILLPFTTQNTWNGLNRLFHRKIVSTMGFQTAFVPGLTLPDRLTPSEPDFESVNSTIPTKNQLKRSKSHQVWPVNNKNDGYHLVSSSSTTQPKITRKLQNTDINRNLHTAALDLGSMANNNKNI